MAIKDGLRYSHQRRAVGGNSVERRTSLRVVAVNLMEAAEERSGEVNHSSNEARKPSLIRCYLHQHRVQKVAGHSSLGWVAVHYDLYQLLNTVLEQVLE